MPARNRASREYSVAHRNARKKLLPHAYDTPCPLCGHIMYEGQALDCDDIVPIVMGGTHDINNKRITHASCNRSAGATLGNQLRAKHASRDW
jgi:hypothetical protein